jgi:uncharacterized protein with GYD domain
MTHYIYRGRYSADALKGMVANPEDREIAIAKLLERAGGKLLAYYLTFGEDDWLVIGEFPNEQAALSVAIVAAAGGSLIDVKTTVAVTSKEAMVAFEASGDLAKSFKSAGR